MVFHTIPLAPQFYNVHEIYLFLSPAVFTNKFYKFFPNKCRAEILQGTRVFFFLLSYKLKRSQNHAESLRFRLLTNRIEQGPKAYVDVLILGAGMAGLGAAKALRSSGRTFALLEAQSVAGGRISTLPMKATGATDREGPRIDTGAQWLHGRQNELHGIAVENDLLRDELSEEGLGEYLRDDRYRIDYFLVRKVDFLVGEILEECEQFAKKGCEEFPASVDSYLREQFERRIGEKFSEDEKELARQLLDWHIRFQIIDNSCMSMKDISAKLWGSYSFNGESCQAHINMKYGFQALVDCLVDDIGHDKIVYNKEVTEIRWKDLKSRVVVKCFDGTTYNCQHLIVTFSLGVLKASLNKLFQPALPKSYRRSIRNIGFGTIDKIFLQFESAWWEDSQGIQLVWRDTLEKDSHWTRYLSGFDIVDPGPPNTLLGWVGSYGAIEMEKLSDEQIVDDCVFILRKFTNKKVPKPINYFCTRWNSNPFIRGSYSYTSTNCDYEPDFQKALMETLVCDWYDLKSSDPIQPDKPTADCSATIRFAGEACHPKYFSTVHGAYQSGVEQAQKLLD